MLNEPTNKTSSQSLRCREGWKEPTCTKAQSHTDKPERLEKETRVSITVRTRTTLQAQGRHEGGSRDSPTKYSNAGEKTGGGAPQRDTKAKGERETNGQKKTNFCKQGNQGCGTYKGKRTDQGHNKMQKT